MRQRTFVLENCIHILDAREATPDFKNNAMTTHTPGTFLRIRLPDGTFAYARLLESPDVAFYDYRTIEPEADVTVIESRRVLFRQAVRNSGLKKWQRIGQRKLEGEVAQPTVYYTQDLQDFRKCTISDSVGNERSATPEECVGIEQAAVWDHHHIEERLLDTFLERPNQEELRSRVRLR